MRTPATARRCRDSVVPGTTLVDEAALERISAGWRVDVGSTDERAGTCVVVLDEDEPDDWASSCLWSGGYVELSVAGHRYRLTDGAATGADERWTELTTGVYAVS